MKHWIIALFFLTVGCFRKNNVLTTRYSETPIFIQNYLDSLYGGKFVFAEQAEQWNDSGDKDSLPNKFFIGGVLGKNDFWMSVLHSSKTGSKGMKYFFQFEDRKVTSFRIEETRLPANN